MTEQGLNTSSHKRPDTIRLGLVRVDARAIWPGLVALATVLGGYIRLMPVLRADFPLHDGGLFYQMTRELEQNHFMLPAYTAYNGAGIPFAYPPLGMYFAGLFSSLTGVSLFDIFRLAPALISLLTIPAFFLLARSVLGSQRLGALACFAFACFPGDFIRLVAGGGLTRAPALLFLILALFFWSSWVATETPRDYWLTICFLALATVSHPTPTGYGILAMSAIWFFRKRTLFALARMALAFVAVLILTSPWWLSVAWTHGLAPFLNATSGGGDLGLYQVERFLNVNVTGEGGTQIGAALALVGIFWCALKRDWALPVILFLGLLLYPYVLQNSAIPTAMLAAIGAEVVFCGVWERFRRSEPRGKSPMPAIMAVIVVWTGVVLLMSAWGAAQDIASPRNFVTADDRLALSWVRDNTPGSSHFIVLSDREPFADPLTEWFYPLAQRDSIITHQGREWLSGEAGFSRWILIEYQIQQCYGKNADCIKRWSEATGLDADYVYVRRLQPAGPDQDSTITVESMAREGYPTVYDGPGAVVFRWSQAGRTSSR